MRISTKCSIALHCLICIAVFDGRRMTSTGLAASTGSNPVVIRNLFGALQKAGILSVARGTGGAVLLRSPEEITVWVCMQPWNRTKNMSFWAYTPIPPLSVRWGAGFARCSRSPMMRSSLPCEKRCGRLPCRICWTAGGNRRAGVFLPRCKPYITAGSQPKRKEPSHRGLIDRYEI